MGSESIVEMREMIYLECIALEHLKLFTGTTRHDIITKKFTQIASTREALSKIVGEKTSLQIFIEEQGKATKRSIEQWK